MTNKKLIINTLSIITLTITSHSSFSQIFSNSQNQLSVKWREINTNGFRIVFPQEIEKEAQRMANTLPYIYPKINGGLSKQKTTIPLLLQNQGTLANGFVQLAPKKSEFYSTPPQNFDSQDWLNNLAAHELRHVAQFDKLTYNQQKPFPELLYFSYMGVGLPTWFFEGDAVVTETKQTQTGRGRQPNWVMPFRTAILEGKKFSYSKTYFGSDRNQNLGYYQLGYLMAANLIENFGNGIADNLISDITKRPIRLFPFSQSLKKYTGKNTSQYFKFLQQNLTEKWEVQNSKNQSKNYEILNRKNDFESNYFLPVRLTKNKILALKESKAEARHFVLINDKKNEQKLFGIGYQEQPWFSYKNGLLVWDEIRPDLRYKNRSFSVLCSYNFISKKHKTLSKQSRLFSPSLSPDGKKIIAVKVGLDNQFNLVEIGSENGAILKTYPNPENYILQTPSYGKNENEIAYISLNEKGKNLCFMQDGKIENLISNSRQQISRPIIFGNQIAFNGQYNGIDNIYSINIQSKKINALSASKYGAFNFSQSEDGNLIFNDYKLFGFEIAESMYEELEVGENNFVNFLNPKNIVDSTDVFKNIPPATTPIISKKYNQLKDLINFHSIVPVIDNQNTYGLELQSNNLLNTLNFYTGAKYRSDLNRFEYTADLSYKALYPVLSVLYRNRPRRAFYGAKNNPQQGDWRENYTKFNVGLPLSFSNRSNNYSFSTNVATSYTQRYDAVNMPKGFIKKVNFPLEYGFTFNHSLRTAQRDITPKWAQVFRLSYRHQPFDNNYRGEILALESFLYFPGFEKNHSFLASFNYQKAWGSNQYDTEIATVYGYNNILAKSKLKNSLLFNYRFPFAYPDWELGSIAYVRNLRAGLFCHYENIGKENNLTSPKSYGLELNTSVNLLRYLPVVDLGARVIFVNKIYNQNPILEFSFNYTL
jgi:hypothetical protein